MGRPLVTEEATAEPEIDPNNMAAMMWTKARPPGNLPTKTLAKSIKRLAIPPGGIGGFVSLFES